MPGARARVGKGGQRWAAANALLRDTGPEIIAGASDNDPTNVGTAVVVGARNGYQLSWVALLVAPMLGVVLAVAAQVSVAAGSDLQSLARLRYGRRAAGILLLSVVAANVVTIAADLQAGAVGVGLLAGVSSRWLVLPLAAALAGLLLAGRFHQMAAVLRWALPGFLAFIAAAMLARPNWLALAKGSVVPALSLSRGALAGALALLGTTLTSYVYVWETVQRGMEEPAGDIPTGRRLRRVRTGAVAGAVFTAAILWSMLAASAATLGRRHRAVDSARDAAAALRPFAGPLAADLFAAGLVVSAVVALPVLVACTGYMVGAQFDWRRGLSVPVGRAPRFYAALIAPVALAVTVTLAGVPVFGMLVAASLIGGLATPIGLVILLRLARDHEVMRGRPISARLATAGWAVCLIVAALGILLILKTVLGSR